MNSRSASSASEHIASNRACEACRSHKVRCLPDNSVTSKICQRCARTDRRCVFATPQKRKQRKRTDTRVAELEREVSAMRALFDGKKNDVLEKTASGTQAPSTPIANNSTDSSSTMSAVNMGLNRTRELRAQPMVTNSPTEQEYRPPAYSPDSDFIERGVVTAEEAEQLFRSYNDDLVQYYPGVIFPTGTTVTELRRTKPTLLLAAVAAAAGKADSRLYSILNSEVLCAYAHRTIVEGEKSLELVQTFLITSCWYFPPGKFAKLKFYEYIHMATTMALDIDLGTDPKTPRHRRGAGIAGNTSPSGQVDGLDLEKRRTFLTCYMISTGVSMGTRRPNMLRWSSWLDECLNTVGNNPSRCQNDRNLVAWVRLMKITEEIGTSFSFEDPSNMADMSDSRVRMIQSGLGKALSIWREEFGDDVNDAVMLQYHNSQLYLYEIALHFDHAPADFAPPYDLAKILSIHTVPGADTSFLFATTTIISSAHSLLEILLAMDIEALRSLPIANFVRMAYAVSLLVKLYISSKSPTSSIGALLDPESLNLGTYLSTLVDKLVAAVGQKECRAPYVFLGFLMRLYSWYKGQEKSAVFVQPYMTSNVDQCWLPPMPGEANFNLQASSTYEATARDGALFNDHSENGALQSYPRYEPDSEVNDNLLPSDYFDGVNYDLDGDVFDIERYLAMDGMGSASDDRQNWQLDMDMASHFEPQGFANGA